MVIPLVFMIQLAFIVAFGVLIDTLIVRTLLIPGVVLDIGPKVWWPFTKRTEPHLGDQGRPHADASAEPERSAGESVVTDADPKRALENQPV